MQSVSRIDAIFYNPRRDLFARMLSHRYQVVLNFVFSFSLSRRYGVIELIEMHVNYSVKYDAIL